MCLRLLLISIGVLIPPNAFELLKRMKYLTALILNIPLFSRRFFTYVRSYPTNVLIVGAVNILVARRLR